MRATFAVLFFVGILALGCWRQAGPATPTAKGQPEAPSWRALDETTAAELAQAWKDNPTAAVERYEATRFRLKVKVMDVGAVSAEITPASKVPGVDAQFVTMRDDELNKLVKGKEHTLEFRITRYVPGLYRGIQFESGTVVPE